MLHTSILRTPISSLFPRHDARFACPLRPIQRQYTSDCIWPSFSPHLLCRLSVLRPMLSQFLATTNGLLASCDQMLTLYSCGCFVLVSAVWPMGFQCQQRDGPVSLAVDGLALVYHMMQNAGAHDLRLELGWVSSEERFETQDAVCSPLVELHSWRVRNATLLLLFLFHLGNTDTGAPPTLGFGFNQLRNVQKLSEFDCQRVSQGATTEPFMRHCWATCRPSPKPEFRCWLSWTACKTARRKPPPWKGVARRYGAPRLPVPFFALLSRKLPPCVPVCWLRRALVLFVLGMRRVATLEGGVIWSNFGFRVFVYCYCGFPTYPVCLFCGTVPQAADASEVMVLMQPGGEGTDATFLQQHCSSLLPLFAVETLAAACISAGVSIRSDQYLG